jgi:hypothetical protein
MGKLDDCPMCGKPVLELEGQFELLQSYFTDEDDPATQIFGEVHTTCFAASPHGATWTRWRINHFSTVRGYAPVGARDGWTVLTHPRLREVLGFHDSGASIAANHRDRDLALAEGGGSLLEESESHITLADPEFTRSIQEELLDKNALPLRRITDHLGISDRLYWPDVLTTGKYVFSRQLRREWSPRSFSATVRYLKFLPEVVLEAWRAL